MKTIFTLTGIAALLITACNPEPVVYEPVADFTVSTNLVVPNEVVFFTNHSLHGEYYEWDFDDGYTSNEISPSHYYSNEGVYEVRLAAYNHGIVDYAYFSVEVYETTLEVEVREWATDALIPAVNITLYPTYNDWYNFTNPIINAYTDNYGIVVFKGLQTIPYYINAFNEYYDNEQLGFEDIDFIATLPLQYATYNTFTAYVDYYPPEGKAVSNKSTENRTRKLVVKEIKRVYKDKVATAK
jgi:PKD repeat protein